VGQASDTDLMHIVPVAIIVIGLLLALGVLAAIVCRLRCACSCRPHLDDLGLACHQNRRPAET
jgi:uncharacterized membrane protein